jgi:hypothetical protein
MAIILDSVLAAFEGTIQGQLTTMQLSDSTTEYVTSQRLFPFAKFSVTMLIITSAISLITGLIIKYKQNGYEK